MPWHGSTKNIKIYLVYNIHYPFRVHTSSGLREVKQRSQTGLTLRDPSLEP